MGVHDVAQGTEQHLTGAGDHFSINESIGRGIEQLKLHTTVLLMNTNLKVFVSLKDGFSVVDVSAGIEDGKYALTKQGVAAA